MSGSPKKWSSGIASRGFSSSDAASVAIVVVALPLRVVAAVELLIIAMLAADLGQFETAEAAIAHIAESTPRVKQVKKAIREAQKKPPGEIPPAAQ